MVPGYIQKEVTLMQESPSFKLDLVETIVLEASKLPIEEQEYILAAIRVMLYARQPVERNTSEEKRQNPDLHNPPSKATPAP